jgi:transposase-like protein
MKHTCPYCITESLPSESRSLVKKAGYFRRSSDSRSVQRFRCLKCRRYFSSATFHRSFRQKKRHLNERLRRLLCSGVSQRRAARLLNVSRRTIERKFLFLGQHAIKDLETFNLNCPKSEVVEFDDLETFEHSKCKPLSVTLAVESQSRRILGFEVSRMPAKGKLTKIALKKYGRRYDKRCEARQRLFLKLKPLTLETAIFKSDQNPHYPQQLKAFFPFSTHETCKGQRGSIVGQGELKKIRFDPIFSLNHTCAMLRANMNRLFRRTWCTTKLPERLNLHLAMYAVFHNKSLLNTS